MLSEEPTLTRLTRDRAPPDARMAAGLAVSVGRKVRQARTERQLTLEGLAAAAHLSTGRVRAIENGENRVQPEELWDIAQAVGRTLSYFFDLGDA